MDDIYKYLDYREYLRDHYQFNKSNHRYFSFRYVAGKTGLDASFYVKVINKQKHIANSAIPTLINFLKLSKREGDYFSALVHFNKSKSSDQETYYFEKLLSLRKPLAMVLENDLYEYFGAWWNVVLREELNILTFENHYDELATRLLPPITPNQVRRSLKLLEKLGMICHDDSGAYRPTHDFITTNGADHPQAIRSYQKSVLKLAANAIDTVPKEERDISTLTVSTSRNCLEYIRERINEVRREIIELARKEESAEEVYQINFQVFPLTQNRAKNKK